MLERQTSVGNVSSFRCQLKMISSSCIVKCNEVTSVYVMSAIKTEPDSDSESHSATLKDDFEFVAIKYEQDPLEDTHNVSAMKVRYILVLN